MATVLDRRYGWHVAEQATLEVDRIVRLGKPVRSPELSPPTSPVPTYATDGTGACAAKPASPCTGHVESNSTPEPKVVTAPANRHRQQPRTQLPNLGGRFRSPLRSHGSSTGHISKLSSPASPHP